MTTRQPPMLWVHATVGGDPLLCSVAMRYRETLEEAMGRGVAYLLLDTKHNYATEVWTETMDAYNAKTEGLMEGRIPGAIVEPTGSVRWSK